jgi:hypothetical protein
MPGEGRTSVRDARGEGSRPGNRRHHHPQALLKQATRGGENKRLLTQVECVASRLRPAVVASVGKPKQGDGYPPVASGEFRRNISRSPTASNGWLAPRTTSAKLAEEVSRRFVIQTPIRAPASRVAVQRLQFADRQETPGANLDARRDASTP